MRMDHLSLDITTTLEGTTVTASGEIDMATVDQLKDTLTAVCVDGATVHLDFRDVTFMDSTGINALVIMDRRSKQRGGRLVLSAPSPAVLRLLGYTGAETVLNVDDHTNCLVRRWTRHDPSVVVRRDEGVVRLRRWLSVACATPALNYQPYSP